MFNKSPGIHDPVYVTVRNSILKRELRDIICLSETQVKYSERHAPSEWHSSWQWGMVQKSLQWKSQSHSGNYPNSIIFFLKNHYFPLSRSPQRRRELPRVQIFLLYRNHWINLLRVKMTGILKFCEFFQGPSQKTVRTRKRNMVEKN